MRAWNTESIAAPDARLLKERWESRWIADSDASATDYGVYHFRKVFTLESLSEQFVINVSADNRYKLFVNGHAVSKGPARGDFDHWYYETLDIQRFLNEGKNVIAAVVWNFGEWAPNAQLSIRTGFILQGNSDREKVVNTDTSWRVIKNEAYSPSLHLNYEVGCSDVVVAEKYPWNWEQSDYDDTHWSRPLLLWHGQPYGSQTGYQHVLIPRDIPLMDEYPLRLQDVRRAEGIVVPKGFIWGNEPLLIPPHAKVSVLLDQSFLTTAYPEVTVSGGKMGSIKMTYAEALVNASRQKLNRDEIDGKHITGYCDYFYPDGQIRTFSPLWYRTYRYIQLDIETASEPLIIHDFIGIHTSYPFQEHAVFESNDQSLKRIWEVGWRTARLCANETYMDCPYYEQLQYVGDTRIQALISLYVDGDDRLMRKAINLFGWSRSFEGLTASRYPSRIRQYIPPFSLFWVNTVHDYWMHRPDTAFVKSHLRTIDDVLSWYAERIDPSTGMLGPIPHWNFVDWAEPWPWDELTPTGGVPPGGDTGGSAVLTFQFAYALRDAIDLFKSFGDTVRQYHYERLRHAIIESTIDRCWHKEKGVFADDNAATSFSQHTSIMAILAGAVPDNDASVLFDRIVSDSSLIQATFYYRFYLFRAMEAVGRSDRFLRLLEPWHNMLALGLTTFAERPEPTRSDCHAWSAAPVYELLATVCGVVPDAPGFQRVKVAPQMGELKQLKGEVPHPNGTVSVELSKKPEGLKGTVILPHGIDGHFEYNGKHIPLHGGVNTISL